ncbi:MAG: GNAT family N-acetyltransferase [Firmicutes bacterium]|nr:GNAT family N-acetyltransferase [Bacillota bacterium]
MTDISVQCRRYRLLADFELVYRFLQETHDPVTLNSHLLPQFWEYAHTHSYFNHKLTHRMGLWEDEGALVGIVCYEMDLGDCHMHVRPGYEALLPELLAWAEKELCAVKRGKHRLQFWITDQEPGKRELLQANGYKLKKTDPIKIFDYKNAFTERVLPEGFQLIDGTDVDYHKLHACFWKGFNHGPWPDKDIDGRIHARTAPRYDASLAAIVVAPDGEYACALGMWYDERNHYAYLEPLATVPKYRRRGLATIALTEAMKKTKALGAEYCFGGSREFYTAIGFEIKANIEFWEKEW